MMENGPDRETLLCETPTPGVGTHSESNKLESRLSILALLAPTSPDNSPPPQSAGYHGPAESRAAASPRSEHHTLQSQQRDDAAVNKVAKLQALLPRPSDQQPPARPPRSTPRQPGAAIARRVATIVACENCRAKRTKCDGARPKCSRCVRLATECEYDAGPDETRSLARKRKFDEMKTDLGELQELYEYLRSRPLVEVAEVIRRIRSNVDPCKVLRLVRDGDLLLQASAIGRKGLEVGVDDIVQKLDEAAYQQSPIRLSAQMWTDVAGDGLVSELVAIFFDTEQPFLATYLDRRCFMEDMASGLTDSVRFCSRALANSICALAAFTSKTAKAIDQARGGSVSERFYKEAKRQLDLEHGRVSLANVMTLFNLFLYCSAAGIDRAGVFHRVSFAAMYKKLRLRSEFPSWVDTAGPQREQYRRAVSRASWGLFCAESISSFVYIQPALIEPPTLPRIFDDNREDGPPAEADSHDAILDAECSLSMLMYEVMCYNLEARNRLGEEGEMSARMLHYRKLLEWQPPPRAPRGRGLRGLCQSLFLESYFSVAVVALFRPLLPLNIALPDGTSPAKVVVQHCRRMMLRMRETQAAFPHEYAEGCVAPLYFGYVCSLSLVALLDWEPNSHEPFVEACQYFHITARNFPVSRLLLMGVRALALETGVGLPPGSEPFFSRPKLADEDFRDVPVSYVIPAQNASGESEAGAAGLELGNLIEKWSSSMSV